MQALMVVWRTLPILVIIQGNIIFDNNEKLIIINQLGFPNRPGNSGSGMMKDHGSGTIDGPNGTNGSMDLENTVMMAAFVVLKDNVCVLTLRMPSTLWKTILSLQLMTH